MKLKSLVVAAAAVVALPAAAQVKLADAIADVTVSGHIDVSYDYANTEGGADPTGVAYFNTEDNGAVFHQAFARLAKAPSSGVGGAISLLLGSDAAVLNGSGAIESGANDLFIPEAYLSYATGATTIYAGRLNTLTGAEVIPTAANVNATRGVLFNYQPFYHTGVRVNHKLSDSLSVTGGVMNSVGPGFNDGNEAKTIELNAAYSAGALSTAVSLYVGDENTASDSGRVIFLDNVINYAATPALSLTLNSDYFSVDTGSETEDGYGFSGIANYKMAKNCRVAGRVEYVHPTDGLNLSSYTLTYGHSVADNLEVLTEVRYDASANTPFFPTTDSDNQLLGTVKAVYRF